MSKGTNRSCCGMRRLLADCRQWAGVIEFNTNYLAKLGVDVDDYLGDLSAQADLFSVDQQGHIQSLDSVSPRKSLEESTGKKSFEVDLLLISRGKGTPGLRQQLTRVSAPA